MTYNHEFFQGNFDHAKALYTAVALEYFSPSTVDEQQQG
jgi:hypothetical protein